MRDNQWHKTAVDTNLFLQLQDLTTILSQLDDYQFEFTFGSYIDVYEKRLTASTLWNTTKADIKRAGYITDIYLRAIGTLHLSDLPAFHQFWDEIAETDIALFASQIITLLEDIRLEEKIKQARPGTVKNFRIRNAYLKHYFNTQRTTNTTRSLALDELFCMIYLVLHADGPEPTFPHVASKQLEILEEIKPHLYEVFEAKTTAHIASLATNIVWKLSPYYNDMINTYMTFPIYKWDDSFKENTLFDELTRTDDLANFDQEEVDPDKNEYIDEAFSTWHRENENADREQFFLQMDLDVGTKTNLTGGTDRETESGDQAFGAAQGMSKKSRQNDFSKNETLDQHKNEQAGETSDAPYGEENIDAVAHFKHAGPPSTEDHALYDNFVTDIAPYQRKLARTIEKMMEHKQIAVRQDLQYGRLSRNLLPIVTDDNPRLFYKKDAESNEFDAIFTLMVDCSASMFQKMEETKRGIVLFHEVLKQLQIPHTIVGFWEDATTMNQEEQPNYFHMIHSFHDSLHVKDGAKIMQLEAEEDNRDGFSIRVMTEKMMERSEKHKFLLVFSDGEPAAANYDQNGIVDTHVAVTEARKKGIDVIGMFLSDGSIDEREDDVMENIYGNERLMIPNVAELPELFTPVLKKLLLKSIM